MQTDFQTAFRGRSSPSSALGMPRLGSCTGEHGHLLVLIQRAIWRVFLLDKEMTCREIWVGVYSLPLISLGSNATCLLSCRREISSHIYVVFPYSALRYMTRLLTIQHGKGALHVRSSGMRSFDGFFLCRALWITDNFFYTSQLLWKGSEKPMRNMNSTNKSRLEEDTAQRELDLRHGLWSVVFCMCRWNRSHES